MAGTFHKIMAYLGLVDDYDDYDDLSDRRPAPSRPASPPRPQRPDAREPEYDREDDRYDSYDRPPPNNMGTVSRIRPVNRDGAPATAQPGGRPKVVPMAPSESARPYVVAPVRFSDAKEIGDHMRQSNPVIVNLQQADRDLQRRMIDFCSGIAYALSCDMERVADQVFLLTPSNVTVSAEERARLESRGFNSDA
jgi:cell division inhibitor SepF